VVEYTSIPALEVYAPLLALRRSIDPINLSHTFTDVWPTKKYTFMNYLETLK
jgi:hypothetical protein